MDETDKKIGKNHNLLRGIFYTGIVGMIGVGAYLIAKYKHLGGRASYTIAGLVLLVSAPKIIDAGKTYLSERNKLDEIKIYTAAKKDSLDAVIRLNAPKSTSTLDITDSFTMKKEDQYNDAAKVLRENTEKLQNTIEELKHVQATVIPVSGYSDKVSRKSNNSTIISNNNYASANNSASINNSAKVERIASQNTSISAGVYENITPSYYYIDADKSNGEIQVFRIGSDGSKKYLSITSKASFATSGGPADGEYILRNKGARRGDLYPGFLEMKDPIGISGAGEYNEHLEDIQVGALANKTGIRVPNEVYVQLARLVDEKNTVISVHE